MKDFKIEITKTDMGVKYEASYVPTGKMITSDITNSDSSIRGSILMLKLAMIDMLLADDDCRKRIKERLK